MSEGVIRRHSFIWFPFKALVDEINEAALRWICLHHQAEFFAVDCSSFTLTVWLLQWLVVVIKEHLPSRGYHDHAPRWRAFYLHDALHLFFFILTGKNREANKELV